MKTRIFNKQRLFIAIALLAIGNTAFAQETAAPAPEPPLPPKVYTYKENKDFKQGMSELKIKMHGLKKQMVLISKAQSKNITIVMKGFDKQFKESFKDFGKNFSGSFSNMTPELSGSLNGINCNNNLSDEEYKQQVENGQISEKVKNYSKTYSVDRNDLLQISNSFGKVTVNTWNRSEFKVDVQMKFGSENESVVDDMINGSSISDSKVGSTVSFRTNLYQSNRRGNNQKIEINYTVYMPAGNPVDITNKFGGVVLPDLSGKTLIRVSYGALNAQQLLNSDNDVQVKFGDANITTFNGGKLLVAYGKLKAGTVNNIDAEIQFSSIDIDRLKTSADINIKYGSGFNIGTIDKSLRNLNINASFTKINLDFGQSESFNFDVTTKFGSFHYDDDRTKVTSKSPSDEERGWSSTKSYKGYIGKNNTDGKIVINANYTGVNFN